MYMKGDGKMDDTWAMLVENGQIARTLRDTSSGACRTSRRLLPSSFDAALVLLLSNHHLHLPPLSSRPQQLAAVSLKPPAHAYDLSLTGRGPTNNVLG